ncbi:unnamed protein product [Coregonus sp. 'balchen']|nr:unnamed protein product [Coregonus sp. 'balchen']
MIKNTIQSAGLLVLLWLLFGDFVLGWFHNRVKTKTYNNQYSSKEDAPDSQDQSCFCHSIDVFNNFKIYPRIQKLTERDYFRYYRVNLNRPCPFWADDGHCSIKDCQVEPCPEVSSTYPQLSTLVSKLTPSIHYP